MRVVTPKHDAPSPAAIARVELLIRTWLRADEAAERAWDESCRARREAIDALRTIGGEHSCDGWNYTAGPSGLTLERKPVRVGKWKRGAP